MRKLFLAVGMFLVLTSILAASIVIDDFSDFTGTIENINTTQQNNFTHLEISDVAPFNSLVFYTPFDDNQSTTTTYDYTPSGDDGTITGAIYTDSGLHGGGYIFDGGDTIISDPDDWTLNYTLSIWAKSAEATPSLLESVFSSSAGGQSTFQVDSDGSGNYRVFIGPQAISIGAIQKDVWQHIVVKYNGTHTTTYLDGSYSASLSIATNAIKLYKLGANRANSAYFNGTIDEVMIYNISLTNAQILDIYNNQSSRFKVNGTQGNMTFNMTLDSNWVEITETTLTLGDSSILKRLGEWNGTDYNFSSYQTSNFFKVNDTSTINFSLEYKFNAGNSTNPFYSPLLKINSVSPISGSSTNVTDCADLLSENTIYTLQNDINTDGTCIRIFANNITFDMAGYNITGDADSGTDYGIDNTGNYDNLTVKNGGIYDFGSGIRGGSGGGFGDSFNFTNLTISSRNTATAAVYGIYVTGNNGYMSYITITNQTSSGNVEGIIFVGGSGQNVLRNIISNDNKGWGIDIQSSDNVLDNVTLNSNNVAVRVAAPQKNNNVISNFSIWNCTSDCIFIGASNGNNFTSGIINSSTDALVELQSAVTSSNANTFFKDVILLNPGTNSIKSTHLGPQLGGKLTNFILLNVSYDDVENIASVDDLTRRWYYQAYTNDTNGNDVSSANVTANNVTEDYILNLTTNASGWTQIDDIIDYANVGGTRTYYSNYTIFASNSSYLTISHEYNVTLNQNNFEDIFTFQFDETPPNLTIDSPLNQTYTTSTIDFNVTTSDKFSGISSCWYSLDNGETNITLSNTTASNFNTTNSSMSQGNHIANFYCNDTLNNINDSESVEFFIDSIEPSINLISPENNSEDTDGFVTFSYNVTDENSIDNCSLFFGLDLIQTDTTITKDTTQSFTLSPPIQNDLKWRIECTDQFINIGVSETRTLDTNPGTTLPGGGGGGGGGGSKPPINEDLCNLTFIQKEVFTIHDEYFNLTGRQISTNTIRRYLENWQEICSDKLRRTRNESLVCNQIHDFAVESNNTINTIEIDELRSLTQIEISKNLLTHYILNYKTLCSDTGLSPEVDVVRTFTIVGGVGDLDKRTIILIVVLIFMFVGGLLLFQKKKKVLIFLRRFQS